MGKHRIQGRKRQTAPPMQFGGLTATVHNRVSQLGATRTKQVSGRASPCCPSRRVSRQPPDFGSAADRMCQWAPPSGFRVSDGSVTRCSRPHLSLLLRMTEANHQELLFVSHTSAIKDHLDSDATSQALLYSTSLK